MLNPKNNPIPTLSLWCQLIPGEFNLLALALILKGKPSGLKDYNNFNKVDTNNVSSFINYIIINKQAEGLPPIKIKIWDTKTFARMVAQEPNKYYRLLQNYYLKLTWAEIHVS